MGRGILFRSIKQGVKPRSLPAEGKWKTEQKKVPGFHGKSGIIGKWVESPCGPAAVKEELPDAESC